MLVRGPSHAENVGVTCSACGAEYRHDAWLLIDGRERPDLVHAAQDGSLFVSVCPNDHEGRIDLPRLLALPDSDPELVYMPMRQADEAEARRSFHVMVDMWAAHGAVVADVVEHAYERACLVLSPRGDRSAVAFDSCHQLAGGPPAFLIPVLAAFEAERRSAELGPALATADVVARWEEMIAEERFAEQAAWFRRGALAEAGAARFRLASSSGDGAQQLERAVSLFRAAVGVAPLDPARGASLRFNLGMALKSHAETTGSADSLDDAVAQLRAAAQHLPSGGALPRLMHFAAAALMLRFESRGEPADLEDAIVMLRRGIGEAPTGAFIPPRAYADLSVALQRRFARSGDARDLDEALELARCALNEAPDDADDQPDLLNALGMALETRYLTTGDGAALDQAIDLYEHAGAVAPTGDAGRHTFSSNLANALRHRFARDGRVADLRAAVSHAGEAVEAAAPGRSDTIYLLNNFGSAAHDLYRRLGEDRFLDQAIEAFTDALGPAREGSPAAALVEANLGVALVDRFRLTGSAADLDASIDLHRRALRAAATVVHRADAALNLAIGLLERQDAADLAEAVELLEEAATSLAESSPDAARIQGTLAAAHERRYRQTGDVNQLAAARAAYRRCCELAGSSQPEVTVRAGQAWGSLELAAGDARAAAEAFGLGLVAIDHLVDEQGDRDDAASWLRDAQRLGGEAAYALARCGDGRGAVLAMEGTRARLVGAALQRHEDDLTRLVHLGHADLLARYRAALSEAEKRERAAAVIHRVRHRRPGVMDVADLATRGAAGSDPFAVDLARAALRDQDGRTAGFRACIEDIRAVAGFEDFLRPPAWPDVLASLTAPLPGSTARVAAIYLTATRAGGVALVVAPGREPVPVWLDLTTEEVARWLVSAEGDAGYLSAQLERAPIETALARLLPAMSSAIMGALAPVLEDVVPAGPKDEPARLILIPGGLLAMLPFHAAPFDRGGATRRLIDEHVVSYVPSADVLRHCRRRAAAPVPTPSILAIGNPLPLPDEWPPLRAAQAETDAVAALFAPHAVALCGERATSGLVSEALGKASHLHVASHGRFDPEDPIESGLVLANGDLLALGDLQGPASTALGRLAVLSACQTAMSDLRDLPEEVVGLPAALMERGFGGVIGGLWPIDDVATPFLMAKLYDLHLHGEPGGGGRPMAPAEALRGAQLWLRELDRDELRGLATGADDSRVGRALAGRIDLEEVLELPAERPFADPYYWGALACYGV